MHEVEDLIKAGFVFIFGAIILSALAVETVSTRLVDSFINLGVLLIILAVFVGIASLIFKKIYS